MGKLHHLKVGCADCSVIKTASGDTFLVDCHNISDHKHLLPTSKRLRGVFVTHQHSDHYSGLDFLRKNGYAIDCLVYSPYERKWGDNSVTIEEWNEFSSHVQYFQGKGTKTYTPYRQDDFTEPFWKTDGLKFWMIGPDKATATADGRELHDACLVIHAKLGDRRCLFAGDASDTSLQYITDNTKNFCDDILHASHHGSLNGAYLDFVKKCNAEFTVVSTESGTYDNVPHPTAMRRYHDHTKQKVYRTDQDGSQVWTFAD